MKYFAPLIMIVNSCFSGVGKLFEDVALRTEQTTVKTKLNGDISVIVLQYCSARGYCLDPIICGSNSRNRLHSGSAFTSPLGKLIQQFLSRFCFHGKHYGS